MADKSGKTPAGNTATDHIQTLKRDPTPRFEVYFDHGREDCHDLDDCLLAEAEILKPRESCRVTGTQPIEGIATRGALTVSQRQVRVRVVPLVTAT